MKVDYPIFDADNHYYEVPDAFTRYASQRVASHVQWMEQGKRRHLLFGDQRSTGVPNPTFDPVARPGAFHDQLKALELRDRTLRRMYGDLEPLSAAFQQRDARLEVLADQNVDHVLLFPSLGLCIEHLLKDDVELMYGVFRAFNRWLDDDWGFNYKNTIFAVPVIPLLDVDRAIEELDLVLNCGARTIVLRPGPVYGRSPADPYFDPFWSRVNEAGVLVTYHVIGGPSPYDEIIRKYWTNPWMTDQSYLATLRGALMPAERPILDTLTALIVGNFFGRFPNIKVASIEHGCYWVDYLMHTLDHAGGFLDRRIEAFGQVLQDRPSDVFKQHVWVSPFPEEDVLRLVDLIGADRVLMGSDWPHPEGVAAPVDFAKSIESLPADSVRKVMRDNALELVGV